MKLFIPLLRGAVAKRRWIALPAGALVALAAGGSAAQAPDPANDWANLRRYREENARLGPPAPGENRVVFYGNSITDGWARMFPAMFPGSRTSGAGSAGRRSPR